MTTVLPVVSLNEIGKLFHIQRANQSTLFLPTSHHLPPPRYLFSACSPLIYFVLCDNSILRIGTMIMLI